MALRTFTLILRQLSPETELLSASLRILPICCPALESLTLATTQANYNRTGSTRLSSENVRTFLCETACANVRGKLRTLCLRGVSIDDVSLLRPFSDELCVHPYEPLTRFVYPENDHRRFGDDDPLAG